jgi:hypothetical protein
MRCAKCNERIEQTFYGYRAEDKTYRWDDHEHYPDHYSERGWDLLEANRQLVEKGYLELEIVRLERVVESRDKEIVQLKEQLRRRRAMLGFTEEAVDAMYNSINGLYGAWREGGAQF